MQTSHLERDRLTLQTLLDSLEGYARRHLGEVQLAESEIERTREKIRNVERRLEMTGESAAAG